MKQQKDIWTYLLVTIVSALIWFWAATETMETAELVLPLSFAPPESGAWVVEVVPDDTITVLVEGSKRALAEARELPALHYMLGTGDVPITPGRHPINVAALLRSDGALRNLVSVESADPPSIELILDEIVNEEAPIQVDLRGVRIEGEITIRPSTARLVLPKRIRDDYLGEFSVQAVGDSSRWGYLEPNQEYEFEVDLQPPDRLATVPYVSVTPDKATIAFTVKSLTQEITLDAVRVQLTGPPDPPDGPGHTVEFEPDQLKDVTVAVPADLVRSLQLNETKVFASVYLSLADREDQVTEKRVSSFIALLPDGSTIVLDGRVGPDDDARPMIGVTVTSKPQ